MQPNEPDRILLDRALGAIEAETGLKATVLVWEPKNGADDQHGDATIAITGPRKTNRFAVEIRMTARWEAFQHVWNRWGHKRKDPLLIVAPYITPQIAERCRKLGVYFADGAGNMFLRRPGLHIYITGKRAPDLLQAQNEGRATTPAGLRIVFAFLCEPKLLKATYRELASKAQVALGTIGPVIRDLENRKHVTTGTKGRRMLNPDRLFEEWVAAFPTVLRPKLHVRRFRAPDPNWKDNLDLVAYRGYWGGEVAANRLTHFLEPQTATIYTNETPRQLIVDHRLRADMAGDIEILDVFWDTEAIRGIRDVVPPVLAYADLFATGEGRDIEAARMIYDQYVRPTFGNQA